MEIGKDIIEKAVNCKKNFSCLKDGGCNCCEGLNSVNEKVHFIDFTSKSYCDYKMMFGNSDLCNCPVRDCQ